MAMDLQPSDWNHATCMSSRSDVSVDGKKKKKNERNGDHGPVTVDSGQLQWKKKKKKIVQVFYLFIF